MTRGVRIRLAHAILLIKREDPLPIDLECYLVCRGIDVSRLYDLYRP
jgi:hypothetical protein